MSDLGAFACCLRGLGKVDKGEGQDDQERDDVSLEIGHCYCSVSVQWVVQEKTRVPSVLESELTWLRVHGDAKTGVSGLC